MATNFTNRFTAGGNTGLFTTLYGTCGTAAGTAAKTVTVDDFVLEAQARVTVKFTYANTVASPTLNVNNKGAKAIYWRGAALPSTQYWSAGQVVDFVYDGTYWQMIGAANASGTVTLNGTSTTTASFYAPTSAGTSGYVLKSNGSGAPTWTSAVLTDTVGINFSSSTGTKLYLIGSTATSGTNARTFYQNSNVYIDTGNVLMGAAWNDYAEYRNQEELIEPGYCVKSSNSGKVSKTTEKYQACDGIVSDTFGFAIGQTETCQTPLAVAGRVLAYFEGNREDYQAGDTVCAGPNGKVMKMTREEIKEYPDRIIGLVSEIPEYEIWGQNNIKVNGRIWIKIK